MVIPGVFATLGTTIYHFVGRLNSNGSLDTSFKPGANMVLPRRRRPEWLAQ